MAKEKEQDVVYSERKRWLFFGLPFTFTKYIIKDDMITINQGFLSKVENDCYMYKVQDLEHMVSLDERIFGMGTITCYTGDTTHPKLILEHVKRSKEIKNYILEASEAARMRRRTLNTLDIGAGGVDDLDDLDS